MNINYGAEPMWVWISKLFIHGATAVSSVGHMKWIGFLFAFIVIAAIAGIDPLYNSSMSKRDSLDD